MTQYSDEELLEEIHRVAREVGRPPSLQDYRNHGAHSATTYYNRFGSWRNALEAAGYKPNDPDSKIPDEDLIEEIRRLSDEIGRRPSASEMNEHGRYWVSTYRHRFGSWKAALEKAGYELEESETRTHVPTKELVTELKTLEEKLGKRPSYDEMEEFGQYSGSTYERRFGTWTEALDAAGFDTPTELTKEQLLEDLRGLSNELGKRPTMRDMNEHGIHSPNTYVTHFGSWSKAVKLALDDLEED